MLASSRSIEASLLARPDSPEGGDVPTDLPTNRFPLSPEESKDKKKVGFFRSRLSMRVTRKKETDSVGDTDSELSGQQRIDGENAPR